MKRIVLSVIVTAMCIYAATINAVAQIEEKKNYIKWIEFNVTAQAMNDAMKADTESHKNGKNICWTDILAFYASGNGGNFSSYKSADTEKLLSSLSDGSSIEEHVTNLKLYRYYQKAYSAVLGGMVGGFIETRVNEDGTENTEQKYGLRVCSPIAQGYYFSHYDDFGAARSYGYKRPHLGHDLLGSIGTPVVAVESGYVEALGWNRYGGWRIGIRSFDGKRYHYYAHLRRDHPYNDMYEGKIVNAGEVIGYIGMTGYSAKENVNNISTPHLHYGLQIIFNPSQKDGTNQIWIDMYELTKFLTQNSVPCRRNGKETDSALYYVCDGTPD